MFDMVLLIAAVVVFLVDAFWSPAPAAGRPKLISIGLALLALSMLTATR